MESLLELVRIVTKNKARHIEVLGKISMGKGKVMDLYEALCQGKVGTDEEALHLLYGAKHKHSSYRNLKSDLRKRLLNSLLFVNLEDSSLNGQEKAYYTCHKDWAAVKVLLRKGARKVAAGLAEKTLKLAIQFDLTEIVVQASQMLRFHYGARGGQVKQMREYDELHKKYRRAWFFESLAEEYYALLTAKYTHERATKTLAAEEALAYYEELRGPMSEFRTYRLLFLGHLIRIIAYRSINDYEKTVESCEEAIQDFEAKEYEVKTPIYTFRHQQILAYIQLKQFAQGERTALQASCLIPQDTVNWFVNMELLLILYLHTRQYPKAFEIFKEAAGSRHFHRLRSIDKEQWRINGAYIHFLLEAGRAPAAQKSIPMQAFRLNRFLNEVPVFSRDKQGMNVAILIIQILFLIVKKRYNEAASRMEAIEKYRVRYLQRNAGLKRSNYFIKMLLQIPSCSFHKSAVLRKSERYYKQLKAIPLEVANQAHGIEIIPYEDLWELALATLEPKFYKPRR